MALQRLAHQGFEPELIFDVGAYRGDFARQCKRVWPDARIACFEPQRTILSELREYAKDETHIDIYEFLLGALDSDQVFLHEAGTASSVLKEKAGAERSSTAYEMRTIETVVDAQTKRAPDFLKLDVQGYELEVLRGASSRLNEMQVILAELNLIDIYEDVPLLDELVSWLAGRGWVAYDICGLTRRPLDDALWQVDFLFVPKISTLRKDKRWK